MKGNYVRTSGHQKCKAVTRAGKPVAQLLPLEVAPSAARRRLGFMAGQSSVPEDFDRMAEDEIQAMLNGTP